MRTVQTYLAVLRDPQRAELERVMRIVRELAPQAVESIRYGMPTFKNNGQYLIGVGAFRKHMSLFPGPLKFAAARPLSDDEITRFVIERLNYTR